MDFVNKFHKYFYDSRVWQNDCSWLGVTIFKQPLDLFLYQEIIYEVKPDLIIECGTYQGGSAYFFASILDLINHGKVLSIDIHQQKNLPEHHRITYLTASSTSPQAFEEANKMIEQDHSVMVILDSDHEKDHVLKELRIYSQLVTKQSYLVVEDTNINGHPVKEGWGPGPMEAVKEFLQENNDFVVDETKHKFFITFHPNGFLKKIK